ncbi:hypothetical protein HZS_5228 [Henneguya salminicola]|nr:hypothetical protein HZS_5228 [Henneguya salminicola]
MTSILTIILVSLILSCIDNVICEQNISYKFQLNYGPILDFVHYTPLDQESIVQSSRPVFLDLLVVVTMNACDYCGSQFHNITQYIELLFHSASKVIYFFVLLNV